jgi:DNA-binding transcriptional LysR family regulator
MHDASRETDAAELIWPAVEHGDLRAFLTLAEELHFGRTAERLGITRSRVSQIIRTLEARVGGRLFARTSRQVRITPLGADLAGRLEVAHAELLAGLERTATSTNEVAGLLRLGVTVTTDLRAVHSLIDAFHRQHPECEARIEEIGYWQPYEPLRHGDIDVICNWLAVDEPDLTVGPVIGHYARVLAVGAGHRLADRSSVSIEDLAEERINRAPSWYPRALEDAIHPPSTPSGRPIQRTEEFDTPAQVAARIARGEIVCPTMAGLRTWKDRDGIVVIPFRDLPALPLGLIWCTAHENARIRALARVAASRGSTPAEPTLDPAVTGPGRDASATWRPRRAADMATVELAELRAFFTLADELNFGRTADRLGINTSRVSQIIRALEARVGGRLFDRTSRQVTLTPLGRQLLEDAQPSYIQLGRALCDAREAASGIAGVLRVGSYFSLNLGPHWFGIVNEFEHRHPACRVSFTETEIHRNYLDRLRAGDVEMLAARLPLEQPDIAIGPVLTHERRVLMVAKHDPLARLEQAGVDDFADRLIDYPPDYPREMVDAFVPPTSPSGRPMRRIPTTSWQEMMLRVARGEMVHATVQSLADHARHPNVAFVPISDLPPSETALVWLTANHSPKIKAFAHIAAEVIRAPDRQAGGRPPTARGEARLQPA